MDNDAGNVENYRILYVEDDAGLAYLLQKRLARAGFAVDVATTGEEALSLYTPEKYRVILLDYTLPTISGIDVLKKLAPVDGNPTVIMLTVGGSELQALEALEHGAEDYILKDVSARYLDLLPHVLRAAIKKSSLRRENREQQTALQFYIGELENYNGVLQKEITERTALEAELRMAKARAEDASKAKTEFLANMSHEIRTPMNAVVGVTNILFKSQPLTEEQRRYIGTLKAGADSLMALINDLLDISKIESNTLVLEDISFSVREVVEGTLKILGPRLEEKDLTVRFDYRGPEKICHRGDPTRFQQIVMNLCSNAIKFTGKGGVDITLSISPAEGEADSITLVVRDTGIGIDSKKHDVIFDKFVQADTSISRQYGGTGLGLAITKTLVEKMGGTITVESVEGSGAAFAIALTLIREQPLHSAALEDGDPAQAEPAKSNVPHILLVEDYEPNVIVASYFIEQFGYTFDIATNGQEAIQKIEEKSFSVVLMDVQMPVMDGYTATQMVRTRESERNLRPIPIIGMTANALVGDREKCLAAGMNDYLSKPFSPDELKEKIMRYLSVVLMVLMMWVPHGAFAAEEKQSVDFTIDTKMKLRRMDLASMDLNGDKITTVSELMDSIRPNFDRIDRDRNNFLTDKELQTVLSAFRKANAQYYGHSLDNHARKLRDRYRAMDKDESGSISFGEYFDFYSARYGMMDRNGDKMVSEREYHTDVEMLPYIK